MILYRIKHLFGKSSKKDISSFFLHTSQKERERVLRKVVTEANKEQKALVDRFDKKQVTPNS